MDSVEEETPTDENKKAGLHDMKSESSMEDVKKVLGNNVSSDDVIIINDSEVKIETPFKNFDSTIDENIETEKVPAKPQSEEVGKEAAPDESAESVDTSAMESVKTEQDSAELVEMKGDSTIESINITDDNLFANRSTSQESINVDSDAVIIINDSNEKIKTSFKDFDSTIDENIKLSSVEEQPSDVDISDKPIRFSTNSDVQIMEGSDAKDHKSTYSAETISIDSDYNQISDSLEVLKDPRDSTDSYKLFKATQLPDSHATLISPVHVPSDVIKRIHFATPAYSTPNEMKNVSKSNVEAELKSVPLCESTESIRNLSPIYKKFTVCVEISTMLLANKEQWSGEILNLSCKDLNDLIPSLRRLESPGNMADVSKSTSPSSSSSSLIPYNLKQSRHSTVSTSSSSSIASSASTLARKLREGKLFSHVKKDEINLTPARIEELKQKWLNTDQIYKLLDFLDRGVNSDTVVNDDSYTKLKVTDDKEKEKLNKIEETVTPVLNKTRAGRSKRQPKVKFATVESDNEVSKKRQRRANSADISCTASNFSEGDSVFAKWGDRKFYAATLGEQTADAKWLVHFFDGDKKTLLEEFLIKAEEFTMVGHSVYASQGDDNFTPGIITGCELKDSVLQYIVARDKGDISVPCHFIYITESQARQIRGKTTPSAVTRTSTRPNDNLANVNNKRSTRSKTRLLLADSPKPSSSGTQQAVLSDSDDDGNDNLNDMNMEDVTGVEPESHGVYENGIKLKGKAVTGKMRFARTKTNDKDANVLGPIPEEGSKYFKNLHVLLTCTRPQSPKLSTSDTSKGSGSDSENYKFSKVPFVKVRLRLQLEAGGATVYNNFDDIPQKQWKYTYLISNRPNISAKYIQCIAAGIKCICHQWVIRCCTEKKRCSLQELPLGWSVENQKFYSWFNKKNPLPLKKLNLLIVDTSDKNFYKFWSKVCKLAEATATKLCRDSNLEQVYAVICEAGYRDDHVERVISHNIPLLTTTWLIQSMLHGEPRPFNNHRSYRADYVDSD